MAKAVKATTVALLPLVVVMLVMLVAESQGNRHADIIELEDCDVIYPLPLEVKLNNGLKGTEAISYHTRRALTELLRSRSTRTYSTPRTNKVFHRAFSAGVATVCSKHRGGLRFLTHTRIAVSAAPRTRYKQ